MVFRITIITVGKIKEKNLFTLIEEYSKRLSPYVKLIFKELKDEGLQKESIKISEIINETKSNGKQNDLFILDAKGRQFSSIEFSSDMKKRQEVIFIIGGPDGISEDLKKKCNLLSLSSMTFTHEMTKMILLEQIYRAVMIEKNRKYHK
jgi:23S rRNA (pseudouridine1915-N3)-methyltransferase